MNCVQCGNTIVGSRCYTATDGPMHDECMPPHLQEKNQARGFAAWLPPSAPGATFFGVDRTVEPERFTRPPRPLSFRARLARAIHAVARWVDDWGVE